MSEGRTALVTGGRRGIGHALCERLARDGWIVHTCGTREESLIELPPGVHGHVCDVSDAEAVDRMFDAVTRTCDGLDLLVNNAGILGPRGPLEDVSPSTWRRVFAVNADGPFLVTKAALGLLRAARGTIVNVSSSVGRQGRGGWGPYACSKHALEGMTDVWADELAEDGIVVLSANPGGTATDMRAEAYPSEDPDTLPTASEIANVIIDVALDTDVSETGRKFNCREHLETI